MTETMSLDDKIVLKGFQDEEGSTMIVVKKVVGNYVKHLSDAHKNLGQVTVTLKKVHGHQDGNGKSTGGRSEIRILAKADKMLTAEVTDFNLFVALDKAFKKVLTE